MGEVMLKKATKRRLRSKETWKEIDFVFRLTRDENEDYRLKSTLQ